MCAMTHHQIIDQFDTTLRAYRAPSTVELRVYYLRRLTVWAEARNLHVLDLSVHELTKWLTEDVGASPWTKRSAKHSLSVFYTWAKSVRLLPENPAEDLPSMRSPQELPHPCSPDALHRALRRCTRLVDVLMLLFGALEGMRAGEIACAHTSDIQGSAILVRGKGSKERRVPLHPDVEAILDLVPRGYIFPSAHSPTGHVLAGSISKRIRWLFGNVRGLNAHSLRHKFGCDTLELHHDLMALRDLLGHASVATTQIYTRASANRLRVMVDALTPPQGLDSALRQLSRDRQIPQV